MSNLLGNSRLRHHFLQNGDEGKFTKLYENWSQEVKNQVIKDDQDIEPVVVYFASDQDWLSVSEDQIVWNEDGKLTVIPVGLLSDITIDQSELKIVKSIRELGNLVMKSGDRFYIKRVEAGKPYWGITNLIKMLIKHTLD
jgi:hypothetical protein